MKNYVTHAWRILLVFFVSTFISLIIIQEDEWFKDFLLVSLNKNFSESFDCNFKAEQCKLNIFLATLYVKNIDCSDKDGLWQWHADEISSQFSLFHLLKGGIGTKIFIENLHSESSLKDDFLVIYDHLTKYLEPSKLPISFDLMELQINKAHLDFSDDKISGALPFSLSLKFFKGKYRAILKIKDSNFSYKNFNLITLKDSETGIDFQLDGHYEVNSHGQLVLPEVLFKKNVTYKLQGKNGVFSVDFDSDNRFFNGSLTFDINKWKSIAKIILQNLDKKISFLNSFQADINSGNKKIDACTFLQILDSNLNGKINYNCENNEGTGNASLDKDIEVGIVKILKDYFSIDLSFTPNNFDIDLALCFINSKKNMIHKLTGSIKSDYKDINSSFQLDDNEIQINTSNKQNIITGNLLVFDEDEKNIADLEFEQTNFKGILKSQFLKKILSYIFDEEFKIYADLEINSGTQNGPCFFATCKMSRMNTRVWKTNNILNQIEFDIFIDFFNKALNFKDINLSFADGQISLPYSNIIFDNNFNISSFETATSIKNYLLNFQKDFFAMLNGVLHCSYGNADEGVIAGWILLDKSHLKGNVFSSDVQKEVFSKTIFPLKFYNNNLNLDIIAMCQDQLTINTPFIEASAKFNFKVTGNLAQPNVSGSINLLGGEFKFPYKPLYINSGKIIFSGPSMEPTIDLMAQQTIKKMDVRMNVSGLLSNPDINFESNDNLTKEEIITLLVSGSRDGGIHATVPQVLMKNLKDLLIGSADTSPRLSYLKNVLRPFENITIVPKFSDQSARGGIKGAIEMDISDKLRAKIQKNFSLSEDVLIEVDYDINDNVGIKGIKDERGDLGAEVEMRWKF